MKANILNIQKTYSEIPGTWEFEGDGITPSDNVLTNTPIEIRVYN